jgi:hypothetical protein
MSVLDTILFLSFFTLNDLLRVAKVDSELNAFLALIELYNGWSKVIYN